VFQLLTSAGHTVLKIPTDHPDLNPAVLVWNDVKRIIAEKYTEGKRKTGFTKKGLVVKLLVT